jgi:hypothetical protein
MVKSAVIPQGERVEIAVVIPAYNRGPLIGRAIESVLAQRELPAEIIVVDDGSTDDTALRVAAFGDRVRLLRQRNSGASEARNAGVRAASSTWVAFLDSDDVWLSHHLASLANAIRETSGGAVLYFSDMELEAQFGGRRLWEECGIRFEGEYLCVQDGTSWVMMERQPMMLQTGVFRRDVYLEAGGLWSRLRTRHDTHLFIKLGVGSPMCAVKGVGTQQTSDEDPANRLMSASGPDSSRFWEESVPMYEDLLRTLPSLPAAYRRVLRRRLANAHWRLSRMAWRHSRPVAGMTSACRALANDMLAPVRGMIGGIERGTVVSEGLSNLQEEL